MANDDEAIVAKLHELNVDGRGVTLQELDRALLADGVDVPAGGLNDALGPLTGEVDEFGPVAAMTVRQAVDARGRPRTRDGFTVWLPVEEPAHV